MQKYNKFTRKYRVHPLGHNEVVVLMVALWLGMIRHMFTQQI